MLTQPQICEIVRASPAEMPNRFSRGTIENGLAGDTSIKVMKSRYVAEDSSVAGIKWRRNLRRRYSGRPATN